MQPTIPDLQNIFMKGISLNQVDRLRSLTEAIGWYERITPFFRHKFDKDEEGRFQKAMKAKALGQGGRTPDEQETGLRMALRLFEKALTKAQAPSVEDALYGELEKKRAALEADRAQAEARVTEELEALRFAFGPLGLRFTADPQASRPRSFDANGNLIYQPATLEAGRLPGYGALAVILGELEPALKASAIVRDSQGNASLDQARLIANLGKAIGGIRAWLSGRPAAFADPTIVAKPAPVAAAPKPAAAAPKPATSTKKATATNPYRGLKGQIFDALIANEGVMTRIDVIMRGIPAKDPRRMLSHIAQDGATLGRWTLSLTRAYVTFQRH